MYTFKTCVLWYIYALESKIGRSGNTWLVYIYVCGFLASCSTHPNREGWPIWPLGTVCGWAGVIELSSTLGGEGVIQLHCLNQLLYNEQLVYYRSENQLLQIDYMHKSLQLCFQHTASVCYILHVHVHAQAYPSCLCTSKALIESLGRTN